MKRIVILVPDKMKQSISTYKTTRTKEVRVNKKTVVKMLESNEYDFSLYFPEGSVVVESIENVKTS